MNVDKELKRIRSIYKKKMALLRSSISGWERGDLSKARAIVKVIDKLIHEELKIKTKEIERLSDIIRKTQDSGLKQLFFDLVNCYRKQIEFLNSQRTNDWLLFKNIEVLRQLFSEEGRILGIEEEMLTGFNSSIQKIIDSETKKEEVYKDGIFIRHLAHSIGDIKSALRTAKNAFDDETYRDLVEEYRLHFRQFLNSNTLFDTRHYLIRDGDQEIAVLGIVESPSWGTDARWAWLLPKKQVDMERLYLSCCRKFGNIKVIALEFERRRLNFIRNNRRFELHLLPHAYLDDDACAIAMYLARNKCKDPYRITRLLFVNRHLVNTRIIPDSNSSTEYYLAGFKDEGVGISGLYRNYWRPKSWVGLDWFATEPKLQGKGLGTNTLQVLLKLAKSQGYRGMYIETAPEYERALRLYLRMGFKIVLPIKDFYGSKGGDLLFLYKEL